MRDIIFTICLCVVWGGLLQAQDVEVSIKEAPEVTALMIQYVAANQDKSFQSGWRVQILATTDRQKLEATRQQFMYRYPNIPTNWAHTSPWYKLTAGAFPTKLEALRLKHILEQDYTGIYPVKDDRIQISELLKLY